MGDKKAEGMAGYNKRRAEGRDAGAKRKMLQHKTPKLNPINTICYVQVMVWDFFFFLNFLGGLGLGSLFLG